MVENYNHNKLVIVIKIIGRVGNKGQITKLRVRFINNSHKTLIRNVKGLVRLGTGKRSSITILTVNIPKPADYHVNIYTFRNLKTIIYPNILYYNLKAIY